MTRRRLVCACEDVTQHDLEEALRQGHADMESLKRFTGLATGLCQGRHCLAAAARFLWRQSPSDRPPVPTTPRPPLVPTTLGALAASGSLPPVYPSGSPLWTPLLTAPVPPPNQTPLPERTQVVIIGGGIMGLGTAYYLAKNGLTDVVVLERSYLNSGASGRNGGGIREQFSTEQNILLMQESLRLCRDFAKELGINVWLRQAGYLFVATKPEQLAALEANSALQNQLGVPTRILTAEQARERAPLLRSDDLLGAAYNPEDGVLFPWPFVWGYANGARELGVRIASFTPVVAVQTEAGRVTGVVTPRGSIRCDLVINAAAAWAPEVARMAGVTLPNKPERHEILVTESLKPCLEPLVSELGSGMYFSQSMRGEIVGGMGDPQEPPGVETRSSLRFLTRMARGLVHRVPVLSGVRVLRQWAGCYDVTPDGNPIVGEVPGLSGFFQLHGFMGHGFMMAPVVCRIVGAYVARGESHPLVTDFRLERFQNGAPLNKETMIIG